MKIILGDITYPKSEAIIIPSNSVGIMSKGVADKVVKAGWAKIAKEAKKEAEKKKYKVGECFSTDAGRLKRRGVKRIYHCIIKELPSDLISIDIIKTALDNTLKRAILDKIPSVSICGIGIEPGELDECLVASVFVRVCKKYDNRIKIRIMDENKEFIFSVDKILKQ